MARSITFKFGADTSQLSRALGGIRKSIGGMMGGISLGGMLGAGIAGIGMQQMIGGAMNLSPTFANSMLELEESAVQGLLMAFDSLQPHILTLTESLPGLIAGIGEAAAAAVKFYTDLQKGFEGAGEGYGASFQHLMEGDVSKAGSSFMSGFGSLTNALGITDVDPAALGALGQGGDMRSAGIYAGVSQALAASARTQSDPAKSADPRP